MAKPTPGTRLRKLREKFGINLRDLSDATGIDFSLINKYENGRRNLSEENFGHLLEGIAQVRVKKWAERMLAVQTPAEHDALSAEMTDAERSAVWGYIEAKYRALAKRVPPGSLHAALGVTDEAPVISENPEKHLAQGYIYRPNKNSPNYWVAFVLDGRVCYQGTADTASRDEALSFLQKKVAEFSANAEAERKRQLAALENLQSVDDPIISELIESFRREIAEKDKQLEAFSRALEKQNG
jgi:transcriptional regulator with XRE-family HTH domain